MLSSQTLLVAVLSTFGVFGLFHVLFMLVWGNFSQPKSTRLQMMALVSANWELTSAVPY